MTDNVISLAKSPFYRLNTDGSIVGVPLHEFGQMIEGLNQNIVRTTITIENQVIVVSTVFIGVSVHSDFTEPALFETMIFGGQLDKSVWRYISLDKAKQGHQEVVSSLLEEYGINNNDERVVHEHFC